MAKLITAFNSINRSSSSSSSLSTNSCSNDNNNIDCDIKLISRQIPITIDDTLTMIMQIDDDLSASSSSSTLTNCSCLNLDNNNNKDYNDFLRKYKLIDKSKLKVKQSELNLYLTQLITCIGCRTSIEKLYKQLFNLNNNNNNNEQQLNNDDDYLSYTKSLDPLIITKLNDNYEEVEEEEEEYLTLNSKFLNNPKLFYTLIYLHENNLSKLIENIQINKKSRRCLIHSLDYSLNNKLNNHNYQRQNSYNNSSTCTSGNGNGNNLFFNLNDIWSQMSEDSLKQVLIIHVDQLNITMDTYLKKYRFCCDCKSKVIKAFNLLVNNNSTTTTTQDYYDIEYKASIYDGLTCCNSKHIHLKQDKLFIQTLVQKAEIEIKGNRRERHAKTIDIAQEEILTIIGIYLYERFTRIIQQVKLEEQLWQFMFFIGLYSIKKSFIKQEQHQQQQLIDFNSIDYLVNSIESCKLNKNTKKKRKTNKQKNNKTINNNENINKNENNDFLMNDNQDKEKLNGKLLTSSSSSSSSSVTNDAGYSSDTSALCDSSNCCIHSKDNNNSMSSLSLLTTKSSNKLFIINECTCDLINYSRLLEESNICDSDDNCSDDSFQITDEEKREYFENRNLYQKERVARRNQLREKFSTLANIDIRPRMK